MGGVWGVGVDRVLVRSPAMEPARGKRRAWSKNVKCDSPPASSYVYAPPWRWVGGGIRARPSVCVYVCVCAGPVGCFCRWFPRQWFFSRLPGG